MSARISLFTVIDGVWKNTIGLDVFVKHAAGKLIRLESGRFRVQLLGMVSNRGDHLLPSHRSAVYGTTYSDCVTTTRSVRDKMDVAERGDASRSIWCLTVQHLRGAGVVSTRDYGTPSRMRTNCFDWGVRFCAKSSVSLCAFEGRTRLDVVERVRCFRPTDLTGKALPLLIWSNRQMNGDSSTK